MIGWTRRPSLSGFVRDPDGAAHLQQFVVAGISTVLLTRAYLAATGYPQIGGGGLHIAHVLWGGLLMLVALAIGLTYLGPRARLLTAVLGGAGFGLFIDEVGKFLTADNDYFYRPAAAIIYVVFVGLVLVTRWLSQQHTLAPEERLAGALDIALGAVDSGLTRRQRQDALRLLGPPGEDTRAEAAVRDLLAALPEAAPEQPGRIRRVAERVGDAVESLIAQPWAPAVVAVSLTVQVVLTLGATGWLLWRMLGGQEVTAGDVVPIAGAMAGGLISAAFVIRGAFALRGHRLAAFQAFRLALLTSVLVTQVFDFALYQFTAVFGLAWDLLLLGWVTAEIARLRPPETPLARARAA